MALLEKYNLKDRKYQLCAVDEGENVVQHAIDVINLGMGDILMRGNTSTRDFLMPILHKGNKLIKNDILSEVALIKVPYYDKVLALSDVSMIIHPSVEQRKNVIKNIVEVLNHLGVEHPNVAVLSLVEKPSFHMGLSQIQTEDLMSINADVNEIYSRIYMFTSNDFSTIDEVLTMRDNLFERLAQTTKEELARITAGESNSRAGMLFLGIISETKTMVLQSRNLLKSRRYFIEQGGKVIRQKRIYE